MTGSVVTNPKDLPAQVELMVKPRVRPLGGVTVSRVWPTPKRRLVGPFIFFDHLQRVELAPGQGLDVPPHPHIGLATVTYLFEGELVHRDSLGFEQVIRPGELNWMSAGAGIVHSERSGDEARARQGFLHGIQSWVALPLEHEDDAPSFLHYGVDAVPVVESQSLRLRLLAGSGFGVESPVATSTSLFYAEADCARAACVVLAADLGERAAYVVSGRAGIGSAACEAGHLCVFTAGADVKLEALTDIKLMLVGGASLKGDRHIWWNFVASSRERIEQAKRDWRAQRYPRVPGDAGYMPAPEA